VILRKDGDVGTRISADLQDPRLLRLLKAEANEHDTTIKDVLTRALEAYFAERLETKALAKLAEAAFDEWDDPRDADYDRL
jgi:hypothetical protein